VDWKPWDKCAADKDATDDEKPQVRMTVKPFKMAQAPTTNEQYWLYDPAHKNDRSEWAKDVSPQNDCPVVDVAWYDAWCFARWCGAQLPTEVEWEYACRAGTTTRYWWGDEFDASKCAYETNHTVPANPSHANPWGLMEMSGNVWEWCNTWYHEQLDMSSDPDFVGESRVLRGGSLDFIDPRDLRSAARSRDAPASRDDYDGFRISRTP
jgi:formylglycine-generating enzyme required for sulfatase activity